MNDTPCTPDDRGRIIQSASQFTQRIHYYRWIAEKLLTTDDILIRKEAAAIITKLLDEKEA